MRTPLTILLLTTSLFTAATLSLAAPDATAPTTKHPVDTTPLPPPRDPKTDVPGLTIGAAAPVIELADINSKPVNLGDLYAAGPVVITFYRGGWCPFCNKALANWQPKLDDLKAAGATFVAISPETRDHASKTVEKMSPAAITLQDDRGEAMRRFLVAFEVDPDTRKKYKSHNIDLSTWNTAATWELPAPATFVIDRNGIVRYVFADWDYTKRADPDKVIEAVRSLK